MKIEIAMVDEVHSHHFLDKCEALMNDGYIKSVGMNTPVVDGKIHFVQVFEKYHQNKIS